MEFMSYGNISRSHLYKGKRMLQPYFNSQKIDSSFQNIFFRLLGFKVFPQSFNSFVIDFQFISSSSFLTSSSHFLIHCMFEETLIV